MAISYQLFRVSEAEDGTGRGPAVDISPERYQRNSKAFEALLAEWKAERIPGMYATYRVYGVDRDTIAAELDAAHPRCRGRVVYTGCYLSGQAPQGIAPAPAPAPRRRLAAALVAVALAGSPVIASEAASAASTGLSGATAAHSYARPCPTEDSTDCTWDAVHRGNGEGKSFIAFANGRHLYVSHARAHRLTHGGVA